MTKSISKFRIETYGFFIDLAEDDGRIGVDSGTGDVFLDEGSGLDRFQGAVIRAEDVQELEVVLAADGQSGNVVLHFGKNCIHDLGSTADIQEARRWVKAAGRSILANAREELAKHAPVESVS